MTAKPIQGLLNPVNANASFWSLKAKIELSTFREPPQKMSDPKLRRHHLIQRIRCTRCLKKIEGHKPFTFLKGKPVCIPCFRQINGHQAIAAMKKKLFGEEN